MLYIFDMGGVVTNNADVLQKILSILNITEQDFMRYCGCLNSENDTASLDLLTMASDGIIDSRQFWQLFSQRSGITVKTDWWHWLFHPVLNEKTVAVIRQLRKDGHRVVCGTNTIQSHYMNHVERGDYTCFDQTYASFLMGVSKPDPEFWRIILTAEDAAPSEAVFIDDKKVNCDAAVTLGIRSFQFTTAEDLAEKLDVKI